MNITVSKAIQALEAINALIEADKANKFVFKTSVRVKLAALRRKLRPIVEDFNQERDALVKKLGAPVSEGSEEIRVTKENMKEFLAEVAEAVKHEEAIEFTPLTEADLGENQVPVDILDALFELEIIK